MIDWFVTNAETIFVTSLLLCCSPFILFLFVSRWISSLFCENRPGFLALLYIMTSLVIGTLVATISGVVLILKMSVQVFSQQIGG
jgi:hypothetical protein